MPDLSVAFCGVKAPNPFWLASAPPTDKAYNVNRAFEAGWGGVVWKTLGEDGPPIVNVNGPRYGALLSPARPAAPGSMPRRAARARRSRGQSRPVSISRCRWSPRLSARADRAAQSRSP